MPGWKNAVRATRDFERRALQKGSQQLTRSQTWRSALPRAFCELRHMPRSSSRRPPVNIEAQRTLLALPSHTRSPDPSTPSVQTRIPQRIAGRQLPSLSYHRRPSRMVHLADAVALA